MTRALAALAIALGLLLAPLPAAWVGALDFSPATAAAATPSPAPGAGDPRSAGEGPGLVGAPLLAIGAVLGLGLLAVFATVAYVQLTGGPRKPG
ncbi:MAG: hypothetical protein M3067_12600 [Chloroflexota bacterium]|nr:hypothetical protein [Chloroflexota bacterium]